MKTFLVTRKIQLRIDSTDKDFIGKVYEDLYHWQYTCFRAANLIFTHHFIQDQLKDMVYLNEGIKVKLGDMHKDEDGILTSSRLNSTYKVLSSHFKGELPMDAVTNLNKQLVTAYGQEKEAYRKGERSVRNYKRQIPIPFSAYSIRKLRMDEDGHTFRFDLFKIPFRTMLGKDYFDKNLLLLGVINGSIQLKTSAIQVEGPKIFLLVRFEQDQEQHPVKESVIAEASLSIECPVTVVIGKARYHIGDKEEFLHRRLAIQASIMRRIKAASGCRKGNGKKRQMKAVSDMKDKERQYVQSKLHVYSRRLIDLCLKHGAGTLVLTGQEEKEAAAAEDAFLLRNWSYADLKNKIAYKAAKVGINVLIE